jgi:hypothetical protein
MWSSFAESRPRASALLASIGTRGVHARDMS